METIIASVVLPAIIDLFKGGAAVVSRKFVGLSVEDQLKLESAGVEKLKALATLDNPQGTPSQWVVDIRAIYRYAAATLVISIGAVMLITGEAGARPMAYELIGMPFGFIFGERMWMQFKAK